MDDWKDRLSLVYSTNSNYQPAPDDDALDEVQTPARQNLVVGIERKNRAGKTVTRVAGFVGADEALNQLCTQIKKHCGVGGTAKDGLIFIQGDKRQKVAELLKTLGHKVKVAG